MTTAAALRTCYSVAMFLIVFSILNFYIKEMKEEKAWRLQREKFKELQKIKITKEKIQKFNDEFFFCLENRGFYCNLSELFLLKINNYY